MNKVKHLLSIENFSDLLKLVQLTNNNPENYIIESDQWYFKYNTKTNRIEHSGAITFDNIINTPFVTFEELILNFPQKWINVFESIEQKWYENIPEHGVLCWVFHTPNKKFLRIINEYNPSLKLPFFSNGINWLNAEPLTNDEIKQFLR